MTPTDRERIRVLVERTCAEQGIPLVVPPRVAAEIARLMVDAQGEEGGADAVA